MNDLIIADAKIGEATERIAFQVKHEESEYAQIVLLRAGAKIIKIQSMEEIMAYTAEGKEQIE